MSFPSSTGQAAAPEPGPGTCVLPEAGDIVFVRQQPHLVEQVVPAVDRRQQTLVRLACLGHGTEGRPLDVLWESELATRVVRDGAWEQIAEGGFDDPDLFAAYFNSARWNCVSSTDPRLFQSPFRAGIRLDAYQLEPLRKALRLPRVNLFIADDVGLGKTIEAGLIARELLLRKKVREIVVACPPSMIPQWHDELLARFGLRFEVLDREYVRRVRRQRGFGVNPWATHPRLIVSHRLLTDEAYAGPMREWLGRRRPDTLLILDEAHHAAPSGGQRYAIDSRITRVARDLVPRFEHRLFLSATPHNGHSNSFSALLEILDPQRFCRGVPVRKQQLDEVMVRRLKEDLRAVNGGFPERRVEQVELDGLPADAPELVLAELLAEYRELREQRLATATKRARAAAGLLTINLQQRLLSSVEAFARTLRVHRRTVGRQWEQSQRERAAGRAGEFDLLRRPVDADDERATLAEDALWAEEEAQIEAATSASAASRGQADLYAQERALLDRMTAVAEAARGAPDARVRWLVDWIKTHLCPGGEWNDRRLIVFTEYDDTKRYLRQQLDSALSDTPRAEDRFAVFHGPTPPDERERIKRAFNGDPNRHPVRILLATDAAREGLNLQARCHDLVHFDVPWNPSRMEQRNGRIDRKLQPAAVVTCRYFVHVQRPEDRVLATLVKKTEIIRRELGSLSRVIDGRLGKLLDGGIRRGEIDALEREVRGVDGDLGDDREVVLRELESARLRQDELRKQIDYLRNRLDDARKSIGLRDDQFRAAVQSGLRLQKGGGRLIAETTDGGQVAYRFPPLDRVEGADSTWAETMDTLRAPRERGQKLWEWRREAPIRPVVFEDPGRLDDSVVHLHLEQKVVQRLLGRFRTQGFIEHDLSRACLAQTRDAIPRVVLLGRLSLHGPGGSRLHEELVPVTARYVEPELRDGPLAPYAREAEARTLDLLEAALTDARAQGAGEVVRNKLLAGAARDVAELRPHLETRAAEYAQTAAAKLADRADAESNQMRGLLEDQRKYLQKAAAEHDREPEQLDLYPEDERRQLQANRQHWSQRLAAIETELQEQPEAVRRGYEVKATRVEPLGLVYLWPTTG